MCIRYGPTASDVLDRLKRQETDDQFRKVKSIFKMHNHLMTSKNYQKSITNRSLNSFFILLSKLVPLCFIRFFTPLQKIEKLDRRFSNPHGGVLELLRWLT